MRLPRVPLACAATTIALGILVPGVVGPTPALASAADKHPRTISGQLAALGFPKIPNTIAWAPGTAYVSTSTAPAGTEFTIGGVAPASTKPGTVLTLRRVRFPGANSSGVMQDLGVTATVAKNRTFMLLPTLSLVGTWAYAVGYESDGDSPEFIGFQFQLTTTKAL